MSVRIQSVTILGSTGSIGTSTLDVMARHPDRYRVFALTAATQVELMLAQCQVLRPALCRDGQPEHAKQLAERTREEGLPVRCSRAQGPVRRQYRSRGGRRDGGHRGRSRSGALPGRRPGRQKTAAGQQGGLVVGGELFMDAVRAGGATLLPIDSEHSAVFQSLPEDPTTWERRVEKIMLTASGGPFRQRDPATLAEVTPEQACAHPNWVMGRKISVDSATMMNKALEVIEARYLFGLRPSRSRW
jgi:1-deoxy-D-xylulose-5-phosphate reductoisomerase